MLESRRVLLGVSGGVAALKAVEVLRLLQVQGATVRVILTPSALTFVGASTFAAFTGEQPHVSLTSDALVSPHTELGQWGEAFVVAPATANTIGAYANGLSSSLLCATLLATRAPVLIAPAMHTEMWEHQAVQHNIATLQSRGVHMVGPVSGALAGGDVGVGRMAEPCAIVDAVAQLFVGQDLAGHNVVVTAGGTREAIDPVRYIGNRSSGKQGFAFAEAAVSRGAQVTLITTMTAPPTLHSRVRVVNVESAAEMELAVNDVVKTADVVVMAAAVADFRPTVAASQKIKKGAATLNLTFEATTDILAKLGASKVPGQLLVGFAAETQDLLANASSKLRAKNVDVLVANDVSLAHAGFGVETNEVVVLRPAYEPTHLSTRTKLQVAHSVFDLLIEQIAKARA